MTKSKFFEKTSQKTKRRGVAEVISTLLLIMVTVVGSSSIIFFLNDGFVSSGLSAAEGVDSSGPSLKLVAYDARDSYNLLNVPDLNNTNPTDGILCGISCKDNPKKRPINDGTEFIIIQVRNTSIDPIFLHDLTIHGLEYVWDDAAAGPLVLTAQIPTGNYPVAGKFSIFDPNDSQMNLFDNDMIESGDTVNVLIKLHPDAPDVSLGKGIRILADIGKPSLVEFIIYGGDAR